MKLSVINKLYEGPMHPKCALQYVHPTGTTPTPKLGYPQKVHLAKRGYFWSSGQWCAWWVHILYRAPGDERDLYRLSIDDSINI